MPQLNTFSQYTEGNKKFAKKKHKKQTHLAWNAVQQQRVASQQSDLVSLRVTGDEWVQPTTDAACPALLNTCVLCECVLMYVHSVCVMCTRVPEHKKEKRNLHASSKLLHD